MNSKTYWERRGAQLEQLTDRRTRITSQKVAHLYDEALEQIEAKIKKIYTTFTKNSHISEAEATRLMSTEQTKEARRELEELLERTTDADLRQEILTQLNAPAYGYRISALEALADQVYFEAKAVGAPYQHYTEARLKDLYELGYYRTAFDLSQFEGSNVPFSQLSGGRVEEAINAFWTPDLDSLAGNYSTRVWEDTTKLAENVREIVTRGLMTGGNYADMAAELAAQMGDVQFQKRIDADGGVSTTATGSGAKYRATRLIRTEGNYVTGQAKLQSMRDAGYEQYEFVCLLEIRTCSLCGGLDGKRFPVKDAQPGMNMNPMHPNCRCFVSPVVSERLMKAGTRGAQVDASGGKKETVPASMTYQEWYEKYVKDNPEMLTAQKMLKNKASDQRQFESYRQVLGDEAPKTFAEFQNLKYNDSEGWEALKQARRDAKLQADIRAGKYNLTVNPEKQARHILGSSGYISGRSYLTIGMDELQEIVSQYAGTGTIDHSRRGSGVREIVNAGRNIGVIVRDGAVCGATSYLKIHYSGTGVHVVPFEGGAEG